MKGTFCDNCEEKRTVNQLGNPAPGWYTVSVIRETPHYEYTENHFCSVRCLRTWVEDQTEHV